jgi:SNF2 family DNA or RNA helicase
MSIYKKINKQFKHYKLKPNKMSMVEICKPTKFTLQPQQLFLRDYFSSSLANKGLLIYHGIGAGKTCSVISIAETFIKKKKVIIVLPASLVGNFRDELRSGCGNNHYISKTDYETLKTLKMGSKYYKKIIAASDKMIDRYYTIYSYHK